jgi:16S rRNA processing protein RimM
MGRPPIAPPDGWLEVGRIRRPHGLRGDAFVELTSDQANRLDPGSILWAAGRQLTVVRRRRAPNGRWIAAFDGITDRTAASSYVDEPLYAAPLEDDEAVWVHDLIGKTVVDQHGVDRGECVAVVANPAADLLELASGALVPSTFVVDHDQVIRVEVPDGLFEL